MLPGAPEGRGGPDESVCCGRCGTQPSQRTQRDFGPFDFELFDFELFDFEPFDFEPFDFGPFDLEPFD